MLGTFHDVESMSGSRTLQPLSEQECWRLLSQETVGRVACTRRALPAIVPVNFSLSGHDIMLRTDPFSELGQAIDQSVVAFEVDRIDAESRTGWSVLVVGKALATQLPEQPTTPGPDDPRPWAAGDRSLLVRIKAGEISGRRLVPPSPA